MTTPSSAPSSKHLKLKELTDDGVTNSYNEFNHKEKLELQAMGYWKFIEGMLPVIPQLKWTKKIRGPDETSTICTIVITSNEIKSRKLQMMQYLGRKATLRLSMLLSKWYQEPKCT